MHTPEQAASLWCPMSRVAQAGNIDIPVAYNRSLTKQVTPTNVVTHTDAEAFKLGGEAAETKTILVMTTHAHQSMAANCLGDKCAMWRWGEYRKPTGEHRTVAKPFKPKETIDIPCKVTTTTEYGFCGLAGRPEIF